MDKIICVGKNYLEHAKELGDTVPEKPVLFLKPPSTLVIAKAGSVSESPLPANRGQVHPECEIVGRITVKNGKPEIDAVTLGLDMTLRDVQSKLKKNGHPWEISKVFRGASVIGPWVSVKDFPDFLSTPFSMKVDGQLRQQGLGSEMRVGVQECLRYAAENFPICAGDLLFTGTPAGVGPVEAGQVAQLTWGHHLEFSLKFSFS